MIIDHKEHRVVLGVDAATLPHVCRLTGCPRGGRVCQAEEGMLPPRGANRQREFKLRQNFPSLRDLDGSVVYLKVSDFFLGGIVLPNVIYLSSSYMFWATVLEKPP